MIGGTVKGVGCLSPRENSQSHGGSRIFESLVLCVWQGDIYANRKKCQANTFHFNM